MKLKEGLVLRQVAGEYVVLATGGEVKINGMITLNETGALLWKKLEAGAEAEDLTAALLAEYEVDEATAKAHVQTYLARLGEIGVLA